MAYIAIFEIFVNFIQYLSIVASIRIKWPENWVNYVNILSIFQLDFASLLPRFSIPPLDIRAQYLILTNLVPLLLCLILLIFFKPLSVVIMYFITLASICGFICGFVVYFLPNSGIPSSFNQAKSLMIASGTILGCALLLLLLYRKLKLRQVHPNSNNGKSTQSVNNVPELDQLKDETEGLYKPKKLSKQLRNFFIGILFIGSGLEFIANYGRNSLPMLEPVFELGLIFGISLICLGGFIFYLWFSNLFYSGRKFNSKVYVFFEKNILFIVLFIQSSLYIPYTSSLLSTNNCVSVACSAGYEFVSSYASAISVSSVESSYFRKSAVDTCKACLYNNCTISICSPDSDIRLSSDPSISCTKEVFLFYLPGSILMFITFTLGTPYLFYHIIRLCTAYLKKIPSNGLKSHEETWHVRVYLSNNSCKSLYSDFNLTWRFFRLILVVQKLILVLIFIEGTSQPLVLAFCLLVSHFSFALLSLYNMPYHQFFINILSIFCFLANAANAAIAVLTGLDIFVPEYVIYCIVIMNVAGPIILAVVALWTDYHEAYSMKRKAVNSLKSESKVNNTSVVASTNSTKKIEQKKSSMEIKAAIKSESLDGETKDLIERLDEELDSRLLQLVVNYYLVLGIAALISLCIVVIGFIYRSNNSNYLYYDSSPNQFAITAEQFEFGSWENWSEFSANCCCAPKNNTSSTYLIEIWKCKSSVSQMNFIYKERLRFQDTVGNGLKMRTFCSTNFNNSVVCSLPTLNSKLGIIEPTLCNGVNFVSEEELLNLW